MRLNITVGGEPKNGYYNIDPLASDNDGVKVAVPMHELGKVVEDAECTEIIVEDSICYLPHDHVPSILSHWISKLRHRGSLIITDFDAREVVKRYMAGTISLTQFNEIMYGRGTTKKNGLDINLLTTYLKNFNMQIVSKKLDNYRYTVIARRP
jgi:hypothetical protein